MAYMLSLALGAALTPLLTKYIDKRQLLIILMVIVSILSFGFYFVPKENITTMYCLQIAIGLALGPKSPLVYSMYADTVDYSLWKTGRRATAMIFSAAAFAQKLGGAFAGAMMGWVLASLGYVANQVQNGASEHRIVLLMTLIPAIFAFVAVGVIWFYPLTDKKLIEIQHSLNNSASIDKESLESKNV
jgi:GPH family glycoside/pentoside/hexuronide:cation symporter